MRENTTGFFKPKSKEKTPSLDERIASDPGRAKQDIQAAKEREADKGRVIRQVQGAKSDLSMTESDPYEKSSTSVAGQIPTEAPKAAPIAAPVVKKAVPKTAPAVKNVAPTSKYRGGRSEADIQAMIDASTPDRMKAAQPEIDRMANASITANSDRFKQDNPDATAFKRGGAVKKAYKSGGAVKSGASRGDGCAIRGRTKGKYC